MKSLIRFFLFLGILTAYQAAGQVNPEKIKQLISLENELRSEGIRNIREINEFYATMAYHSAWIEDAGEYNRDMFLKILETAGKQGLDEKDYQYLFIQGFRSQLHPLNTIADSLLAEIRLTDAALSFFHDFVYGNIKPVFGFDGLNYTPDCYNIPSLLAECISHNQLCLLEKWELPMNEIKLIRRKIAQLTELSGSEYFREEKIISAKVSHLNKPLLNKLYYLGISDSPDMVSDTEIKETVKEAQQQFNLLADGILRSTILQELNVSVADRMKQLNTSLNYYRWIYCLISKQPVIVVNIPSAYMKVYDHSGILLEMKMVVGKPSTPTPTLTSRISEVVLYPYWMVPRSIVTKELLPSIKRNPGYVSANSFQIINNQGKVVNPYKIDWQSMNAGNFPYMIRQSTGCDNALGLIKLDFYNPFSVYLHDTPLKNFFGLSKRYFSHGCMRMEKPMELGHMILNNNSIAIDTLTEKGCIHNQSPIVVNADVKMPVVVWYNPAGIDSTGRVVFYEDVYRKFSGKSKL
jgi:murein L,D-transpeptidase YcbB/YkuD